MIPSYISNIEAKEEFSELLNRVSHNKERIIITRRGKDVAALVPLEDYLRLQESQSKSDLDEAVEAFRQARKEGMLPLEDLQKEIG